ncbi:MAG TPA: hypothetical protein VFO50_01045 [Candidatus Limnocylindrales bacterium]|nr:hypothetical protein [Candidatus Limnocylindrales bacterium]
MKTPAALVALALVVLAGCGGTASPSPSASAVASASAAPASAAAPSSAPSVAGPGGSGIVDRLPHDDPGLEARLPREVDGQALAIFSVGPISVAGNPGADPVKDLAKEIGDGTGDFGLAFANNPLAPSYNIFALRVPGAEAAELVRRYGELTVADTTGAKAESVTIGGKEMIHVTVPFNPIGDVWIYATGDTLFGVQAGSPERATALLALLP